MFRLDMDAIRKIAGVSRLVANPANVAKNGEEISQRLPKLAGLATLAVSQRPPAQVWAACIDGKDITFIDPDHCDHAEQVRRLTARFGPGRVTGLALKGVRP